MINFLKPLLCFLPVLIALGCRFNQRPGPDDQLGRLLTNDDVSFDVSYEVDSFQQTVYVQSEYRNNKTKERGQFPGVLFIDNAVVTLTKYGSITMANYPANLTRLAANTDLPFGFLTICTRWTWLPAHWKVQSKIQ